ncbi:MAG: hypothetical protein ACD_57C00206G0006, partial [uncultured bacterium]
MRPDCGRLNDNQKEGVAELSGWTFKMILDEYDKFSEPIPKPKFPPLSEVGG